MTRDEADQQLAKAIADHAEAFGLSQDDEMLSDYAVIAHWTREVADGRSRYTTHYHTPSVPNHIAVGLFSTGADLAAAEGE